MVDAIPNLNLFMEAAQAFPHWTWEPVDADDGGFDFRDGASAPPVEAVEGLRRVDNVTDDALRHWRAAYGDDWTKDDVFYYCYGLLHSPSHRDTYAADLKKMLPRIPLAPSRPKQGGSWMAAGG